MKRLTKWIDDRYRQLEQSFGIQPFTFPQARELMHQAESQTKAVLSELESNGYLITAPDPLDLRSRKYTLIPPETVEWARKQETQIETQPRTDKPLREILDTLWSRIRKQIIEEFGPLDLPEALASQVQEVANGEARRDTLGLIDRVDLSRFEESRAKELEELLKLFARPCVP